MSELLINFIIKNTKLERKTIQEYARNHRILVNKNKIENLSTYVSNNDIIEIVGTDIILNSNNQQVNDKKIYLIYNKPSNYSEYQIAKRMKEMEFHLNLKNSRAPFYIYNYVDKKAGGLCLISNDDSLLRLRNSSRFPFDKTYLIEFSRMLTNNEIKFMEKMLTGTKEYMVYERKIGSSYYYRLDVKEPGLESKIYNKIEYLPVKVVDIKQVALGELTVEKMKLDQIYSLEQSQIRFLLKSVIDDFPIVSKPTPIYNNGLQQNHGLRYKNINEVLEKKDVIMNVQLIRSAHNHATVNHPIENKKMMLIVYLPKSEMYETIPINLHYCTKCRKYFDFFHSFEEQLKKRNIKPSTLINRFEDDYGKPIYFAENEL